MQRTTKEVVDTRSQPDSNKVVPALYVPRRGINSSVLSAYVSLFGIVSGETFQSLQPKGVAGFLVSLNNLITAFVNADVTGASRHLSRQIAELPDQRILSQKISEPGTIINLLNTFENAFVAFLSDPQLDPALKESLNFFVNLMTAEDIRNPQYQVDSRIHSGSSVSLQRRIQFRAEGYSPVRRISSLNSHVQAVVPKFIKMDHQTQHPPSTQLMEELLVGVRRIVDARKEQFGFKDPLCIVPERCSPKLTGLITEMLGLFIDTAYDFATPIKLDISERGQHTHTFWEVLEGVENMVPSAPFVIEQEGQAIEISTILSRCRYGVVMRFADQDSSNTQTVYPRTPLELITLFEEKLRTRFNVNYQKLRAAVHKVVSKCAEEIISDLGTKRILSQDEKQVIGFQVNLIYSTWLAMVLVQYEKNISSKIVAYKEAKFEVVQQKKKPVKRKKNTNPGWLK